VSAKENLITPTLAEYPAEPRHTSVSGGRRARGAKVANDHQPLFSIVTIVRNGVTTFERAMLSVLSQEYPKIEYIVVDGGSTDGTLEIIRSRDDRIAIWVSETDAGISDAFNKGVAFALGDIVGILNSDDWYEPGAISAAVHALAENGADIAYGKLQYWEGDRRTYLVTSDASRLDRGMTVGHPTVFVRRACYERLGLFRLDFLQAMDYEWLLRAKSGGARFCFVDLCLANMQGGGVGDRHWRKSQSEVARARAIHLPNARGAIPYWTYLCLAIAKGTIRRALDVRGLSVVRRWKHRVMSRIRIPHMKD
jgi:glycosyltransferase involved in cell wall biosynthesis